MFLRAGMPSKLRSCESTLWILLVLVTLVTKTAIHSESQFWLAESEFPVVSSYSTQVEEPSVSLCIVIEQSCDSDGKMSCPTAEQKKTLKSLYKVARTLVHWYGKVMFWLCSDVRQT